MIGSKRLLVKDGLSTLPSLHAPPRPITPSGVSRSFAYFTAIAVLLATLLPADLDAALSDAYR